MRLRAASRSSRPQLTLLQAALACSGSLLGQQALATATTTAPAASITHQASGQGNAAQASDELLLLAVRLNGVEQIEPVRVLARGGRFALEAADWQALHLGPQRSEPWLHDGASYLRLDALAGLNWRVDTATQTLEIDAPANAFGVSRIGLDRPAVPASAAPTWGGWGNYDLNWQRSVPSGEGQGRQSLQALLEAGVFGPLGSGRTSGLVRDGGQGAGQISGSASGSRARWVRLDSTWTHDRPEQMASLRVGDSISQPGAWGRALRFGGLQWATDFSTQPSFLSLPMPTVRGEAALPSTVDVYVDNSRRLQTRVPAGQFELSDLPVVTGNGQVRVVVRDLLGREQVIVQPYYVSPGLLRPGLQAFSFELGAVREDYGLASDRYGHITASATHRLGVSDSFTRELRAEVLGRRVAGGASGIWTLPALGTLQLSGAASRSPGASGAMLVAALDHRGQDWSGSVHWQRTSAGFDGAASGDGEPSAASRTPLQQFTLAAGRSWAGVSVGASVVAQRTQAGGSERMASVNLSSEIGSIGTVSLFALRDQQQRSVLALSFSMVLGEKHTATLNTSRADGRNASTLTLQQALTDGPGLGYQLAAEQGASDRRVAQALWRTERADLQGGVAHSSQGTDWRAGANGGLAWLDGSLFASRRIEGSFAVVTVDDYAGVQVLHDNRPVARTDDRGRALVTGLRGYQSNRISIDASDLPFDADLAEVFVDAVPPARSGMALNMPVRRSRAASFRLVNTAGEALPPGAVLQVAGQPASFVIGFDGRGYANGLGARSLVNVRWPGGSCRAELPLQGEFDDLPDLGTVACE